MLSHQWVKFGCHSIISFRSHGSGRGPAAARRQHCHARPLSLCLFRAPRASYGRTNTSAKFSGQPLRTLRHLEHPRKRGRLEVARLHWDVGTKTAAHCTSRLHAEQRSARPPLFANQAQGAIVAAVQGNRTTLPRCPHPAHQELGFRAARHTTTPHLRACGICLHSERLIHFTVCTGLPLLLANAPCTKSYSLLTNTPHLPWPHQPEPTRPNHMLHHRAPPLCALET